ncbi:hypothetical protein [Micromonospora lutea]|uniref:GNAT family N-acetyltransferase n=1 Tax=Micromonospora lutea TaxID=419825 RepID=A0ABQ4IR52_9ACTN|nr:hypothetical protein [Micromonospora lutea]GIJ20399.1 hypothetical protein Vlu01_10230 [Micromonospora lutea]
MIHSAVRENVAWCDLVCGTHGQPGVRDADAWSVPRRSPPFHPDAVTLRPGLGADLLRRIDAAGVCAAGAGRHLVGYEQDADLAPARRHGFRSIGPLRVWLR